MTLWDKGYDIDRFTEEFTIGKDRELDVMLAKADVDVYKRQVPVTFAKLTDDEQFWAGCKSCVNYDILLRTNMTKCLCTGMVYDPEVAAKREADKKLEEKKQSNGIVKLLKKVI